MVKVTFVNAVVEDLGYGTRVNGEFLDEIISMALGTRVGQYCTREFKSNCCDVTVIIDPKPVYASIEDDEVIYDSVEEMEVAKREQYEKAKETATES